MTNNNITTTLLKQIASEAKKQGLKLGDLAEQAGISGSNFSRAKRKGMINAETLAKLADQVGMELVLQPRNPRDQFEKIQAGKLIQLFPEHDRAEEEHEEHKSLPPKEL